MDCGCVTGVVGLVAVVVGVVVTGWLPRLADEILLSALETMG